MATLEKEETFPVSTMAETLQGSEIIRLAGEINARKKKGENIFNLTIGDFDPAIFPIPERLTELIIEAYRKEHTNYPPANGMPELRKAVSAFHQRFQNLQYGADDFLIAGGARPLIYALYQTIVNPGEHVVFPVPSWNNNHYSHLAGAAQVAVETRPENAFMPSREDLEPFIREAALVTVCSPLNPTGTIFRESQLKGICELILEENKRRGPGAKPVYLMYDQIYWTLTYGVKHVDPVSLFPEMRSYTIYIDGLSKAFAATGVRVGWAFGPQYVIERMKSILGHVGAWAPKAEQVATAEYLQDEAAVEKWIGTIRTKLSTRLDGFYKGFATLREKGFRVDVIPPAAAMYLTVQFDLAGMKTPEGTLISDPRDATAFLLEKAGVALVPFYAFGAESSSNWYRLSVGTVKEEEISLIMNRLREALETLSR